MSGDELRPEGGPDDHLPHRTGLRRSSRVPWIALGVVLVSAAAVALWLRLRTPVQAPVAESAAVAPAPEAAPSPEATPAPGPEQVRSLLEAISSHPLFRAGLEGDPVRRWVVVTDNLALGESPRRQLSFLAPRGAFSVARRGGRTFIAPASYGRYDDFAAAVGSLDAQAVARAYRALRGLLEPAYRALGYPQGSLDEVTARALRRIENAPVEPGEVEVVEGEGALYLFRDVRLENLGAVEKHLLRMGPRNTRLIQAKAGEVRQALGFQATSPRSP
jgi:Protein of unknown function (DUF3014)